MSPQEAKRLVGHSDNAPPRTVDDWSALRAENARLQAEVNLLRGAIASTCPVYRAQLIRMAGEVT